VLRGQVACTKAVQTTRFGVDVLPSDRTLSVIEEDLIRQKMNGAPYLNTLEKALDYYKTEEPRGEYVLVVEGKSPEEKRQEEIASWESMSIEEHMAYYEEQGMDNKPAMKQVAKDRGISKRDVYQALLK